MLQSDESVDLDVVQLGDGCPDVDLLLLFHNRSEGRTYPSFVQVRSTRLPPTNDGRIPIKLTANGLARMRGYAVPVIVAAVDQQFGVRLYGPHGLVGRANPTAAVGGGVELEFGGTAVRMIETEVRAFWLRACIDEPETAFDRYEEDNDFEG